MQRCQVIFFCFRAWIFIFYRGLTKYSTCKITIKVIGLSKMLTILNIHGEDSVFYYEFLEMPCLQLTQWCFKFPVLYQTIQTRAYHRKERSVQDKDQPGALMATPMDDATMSEPSFTGPNTLSKSKTGKAERQPPPAPQCCG